MGRDAVLGVAGRAQLDDEISFGIIYGDRRARDRNFGAEISDGRRGNRRAFVSHNRAGERHTGRAVVLRRIFPADVAAFFVLENESQHVENGRRAVRDFVRRNSNGDNISVHAFDSLFVGTGRIFIPQQYNLPQKIGSLYVDKSIRSFGGMHGYNLLRAAREISVARTAEEKSAAANKAWATRRARAAEKQQLIKTLFAKYWRNPARS